MFRLIVLSCAIAACATQNVEDSAAKILKEQRFNAGDGRAGSAFATENGHIFREETDVSGNRVGQYSYIGDDGKTYTVKYSAGKDGFRILSGDHIPSGGQEAAAFVADPDAHLRQQQPQQPQQQAPVQQAAFPPRPAPRAPAPRPAQRPAAPRPVAAPLPDYDLYDDTPVDPNFNPFVNPHDPTHRDFRFNANAAAFNPASPANQQSSLVPDCADCAGVNPFINPFDQSHRPGGQQAGHLAGLGARPQPQRPAPRRQQQPAFAPARPQQQPLLPTPAPVKNFFPPGQLELNRFEDGFNFDFSS